MAYEVKVPDIGEEAPDEATVSFWRVEEGDTIDKDDDLVELTSDKGALVVPAPVSGTVSEIRVEEGDIVRVGDVLAIIEEG
ncbi:MAG: biotin/lipoyl-binding protein [Candidatus Hydrogenedentes bacterium]|nr:biotin/lipoyl-binding protein [Candidatus Hydrogenedentota bacterium]